jgi:tetratricopeptide (TPR) repeat protein
VKDETPKRFERSYAEGCHLFQNGQFEEAVKRFATAAELQPLDFRPWEMTACCMGGLARWEDCVVAFERARELGHECHQCWYNRATALCRLHRADDALIALERSLAFEPNNAAAWYDRGCILGMAHGRASGELEPLDDRHVQAVAAFERVLALQPDHYGAWYCNAYTLLKISNSWETTQGFIAAGVCRTHREVQEKALSCVKQALHLRPGQPEALDLKNSIEAWIAETEDTK